jgi:hypothetical protein
MTRAFRPLLTAALAVATLVAQQEPPTPVPIPAPAPPTSPAPYLERSPPPSTTTPAPAPGPYTPAPRAGIFAPPVADLFSPVPSPSWFSSADAFAETQDEDDARVVAARKLAALLDRGRLEAEATEATGLRRKSVSKIVDTLVRDRYRTLRNEGGRIVLPESGLIVEYDGRGVRVTALSKENAESIAVREEAAVKNAYDVLPKTARDPFQSWWRAKKEAVKSAGEPLKTYLVDVAREPVSQEAPRRRDSRDALTAAQAEREATLGRYLRSVEERLARNPEAGELPPPPDELLAVTEAQRKRYVEEALKYRDEALKRDPESGPRYEAALRIYERAQADSLRARETDLRATVEALTRARSAGALGGERAERFSKIQEELARAGALQDLKTAESEADVETLRDLLSETRPDVDDYRRAAADGVRIEAERARKMATALRAQAGEALNSDAMRSLRVSRARAESDAQDRSVAVEADQALRAVRAAQLDELRAEIEKLRAEVDALRKERRGPR